MSDYEDQTARLIGGLVIWLDDDIVVEPQCCCDIGDLARWERICNAEANSWHQLWIGHPWIFFKRANGLVSFSNYSDSNLKDLETVEIVFQLPEEELKFSILKIRKQQEAFEAKIFKVLDHMGIQNAAGIARLMVGNM